MVNQIEALRQALEKVVSVTRLKITEYQGFQLTQANGLGQL